MKKVMAFALVAAVLLSSSPAYSSVSYAFCITRVSGPKIEKFGARYRFGDVDPGKEVARVPVSQKYKEADTTNVGVTDYNPANCGPIREEANINMTSQQLKQLGSAIGRGDVVGTATVAAEVWTGVQVRQVQAVGHAAGKVAHWVRCRLGIGC